MAEGGHRYDNRRNRRQRSSSRGIATSRRHCGIGGRNESTRRTVREASKRRTAVKRRRSSSKSRSARNRLPKKRCNRTSARSRDRTSQRHAERKGKGKLRSVSYRDRKKPQGDSRPVRKSRPRQSRSRGGRRNRSKETEKLLERRQREARNALTYRGRSAKRRVSSASPIDNGFSESAASGSGGCAPSELDDCDDAGVSVCTGQTPNSSDSSGSYYTEYTDDDDAAVVAQKAQKPKQERKDDIVHIEWVEGMLLKSRYRVIKLLGDGTFGRVLLVEDQKKHREVAIKVIREVDKYIRNAKREAEILKDIREADAKKKPLASGCVLMHDTFTHDSRLFCLVFEVLGASLYDVLKKNHFRGFWVQDIQSIASQCLEALNFLHDGLNLTHTDLKLENVLFQSSEPPVPATFPREATFLQKHKSQQGKPVSYTRPASTRIKLIDFGNATYELEHHSSVINTRQYRAPEVILALGWNERSDLWSIGCILMELYTGELLFRTHDSLEHLALMERIIERFPQPMFEGSSETRKQQCLCQDQDGSGLWRLQWPPVIEGSPGSSATPAAEQRRKHVANQKPLPTLVQEEHKLLAEFCSALLRPDPQRRLSASAALKHPFLSESYSD